MDKTVILLLIPLFLFELAMRVVALISLARAEKVRGPKGVWALLIIFVSLFGWVGYFILGREDV
ncbi:MAG: PLD nuclease N-terminal domain-containing protein [Planctomycetota bacterium]|jgi:hypothetical protein